MRQQTLSAFPLLNESEMAVFIEVFKDLKVC